MLIVEAYFPFAEKLEYKKRPVLALTKPIGDYQLVICAFISSKIPSKLLPSDVVLSDNSSDFAKTGLLQTSVIRLHKLTSLDSTIFITGQIGTLPKTYETEIQQKLKALFRF